MDVNLDVKVDQFNAAMNEMAERLTGHATKQQIIRNEVQAILQKTLKGTKTATKASIYASQAGREWTYYPKGTASGKFYRIAGEGPTTRNGKTRTHANRYPDALWGAIRAQLAASLETKMLAIGWARKTWYELGIMIQRPIDGGASANAKVRGRNAADDVASSEDFSDDNYVLMVQNSSPLMEWTDGRTAFFGAIAGRVSFYRQNVGHGVFADLAQVAAKYPGLEMEIMSAAA